MAAILEGAGENFARLRSHFFVFESNHQFVINVEAALVEIGGADINNVVDDDQFGVQNLGQVFVDLNSRS